MGSPSGGGAAGSRPPPSTRVNDPILSGRLQYLAADLPGNGGPAKCRTERRTTLAVVQGIELASAAIAQDVEPLPPDWARANFGRPGYASDPGISQLGNVDESGGYRLSWAENLFHFAQRPFR